MEVHFKAETEARLQELAVLSGRAPDELIEEALAGYLEAMSQIRETLDSRYDDVKDGRVELIDGEAFFESLRKRGEELRKLRAEK